MQFGDVVIDVVVLVVVVFCLLVLPLVEVDASLLVAQATVYSERKQFNHEL